MYFSPISTYYIWFQDYVLLKRPFIAHLSFRVDISDTLMYVYEMLGAELLSNLYDKLGRLLTNAEQPTSWQVGEEKLTRFFDTITEQI